MEILLRVTSPDFCAGAVYACDPPICIDAADRIQSFIGHGLNRCLAHCKRKGWQVELMDHNQTNGMTNGGQRGRHR
jgi:hypothetical protein